MADGNGTGDSEEPKYNLRKIAPGLYAVFDKDENYSSLVDKFLGLKVDEYPKDCPVTC